MLMQLSPRTLNISFVCTLQALFRALKTKHSTPKYGLIYHASLIGQAAPKNKGKISRSLAAKTALAIRYDALGDGEDNTIGLESRAKVPFTVVWNQY
jgi:nucleolar protein 58